MGRAKANTVAGTLARASTLIQVPERYSESYNKALNSRNKGASIKETVEQIVGTQMIDLVLKEKYDESITIFFNYMTKEEYSGDYAILPCAVLLDYLKEGDPRFDEFSAAYNSAFPDYDLLEPNEVGMNTVIAKYFQENLYDDLQDDALIRLLNLAIRSSKPQPVFIDKLGEHGRLGPVLHHQHEIAKRVLLRQDELKVGLDNRRVSADVVKDVAEKLNKERIEKTSGLALKIILNGQS